VKEEKLAAADEDASAMTILAMNPDKILRMYWLVRHAFRRNKNYSSAVYANRLRKD